MKHEKEKYSYIYLRTKGELPLKYTFIGAKRAFLCLFYYIIHNQLELFLAIPEVVDFLDSLSNLAGSKVLNSLLQLSETSLHLGDLVLLITYMGSRKNNTSLSGRVTKMGRGLKARATKEKDGF